MFKPIRFAVVIGAFVVLFTATSASAYVSPVVGDVIDAFRPPTTEYGQQNVGFEYSTAPGAEVTASEDGTVEFAGQVGGDLFVTIDHADGIRTSYGPLASIAVQAGETVQAGERIGASQGQLQFDARRGNDYIDPATLLNNHAYLVPLTDDSTTSHPVVKLVSNAAIAWLNS